jgi:hypothetical protein
MFSSRYIAKRGPNMSAQKIRRTRRFAEVTPVVKRAVSRLDPAPVPGLGPLEQLVGVWRSEGRGWNMIALPFQKEPKAPPGHKFRILMNQYDEELRFDFVDDDVPNRGLQRPGSSEADQLVVTLDYQQVIAQVDAEDFPDSGGLAGPPCLAIHHEPGLWLHMKNLTSEVHDEVADPDTILVKQVDVARLASIPHGNSVLALGYSESHKGMPEIPAISGLPTGRFEDVNTPDYDFKGDDEYLAPYMHYINSPFKGNVTLPSFPGFNPADMNQILRFANQGVNIARTTTLTVDTTIDTGGISNAPFSVREAESVSMKSTFWIQELAEKDGTGASKLRLQYSQVVMLEFFRPREDEHPGRAIWPHISINTLEKVPADYRMAPG